MHEAPLITLGWREWATLPELGVRRLLAKIDTGARTSALHVENLVELPGNRVRFEVVRSRKHPDRKVLAEADLVRVSAVRPSSGKLQQRHVIRTALTIGGVTQDVEISLVSRKHMLCRMLVGRSALEGRFLVDSSAKFLHGKPIFPRPVDPQSAPPPRNPRPKP